MNKEIAVVGAGLSGAVVARELANAGYKIHVFESRGHVAGNCHTCRDDETGVMVHKYGPHIFHTDRKEIWEYICQFDTFEPFTNRVKAVANGNVYSLPINLMTINQLFKKTYSPEQAKEFISSISEKCFNKPETFEEQALSFIGRELYETFFRGYTIKQWGIDPKLLPASILKRLPVRFNYDDNYYNSPYQGVPRNGYTYIVEGMLNHPNISVELDTFFDASRKNDFYHVFFSGSIDSWFGYNEGRLAYRTLDFEIERHEGDFQGNAVINYCDIDVPWTRISEHKHFAPWEEHERTIIYREYSRLATEGDTPYYPIRLVDDKELLNQYIEKAKSEVGVTFIGRLGTYRYIDMHVAIAEALCTSKGFIEDVDSGINGRSFYIDIE